jgi:predicted ATP-dependent serine protease
MAALAQFSDWRCLACGSTYAAFFRCCSSCWAVGQIVPVGRRSPAAIDSEPAISNARDLARLTWADVPHVVYPDVKIGAGALVLVSGPPGAGKSSWACRLLDSVPGPVLYVAAEEGLSPTLAARLLRCNVKRENFNVIARASVDATVARLRELRAVACVLDSVSEAAWSASELRHVLGVVGGLTMLIAVCQVNKQNELLGVNALLHEADLHVVVEGMRYQLRKSRFQDFSAVAGGDVLRREEV